jgi:hypothetical protein
MFTGLETTNLTYSIICKVDLMMKTNKQKPSEYLVSRPRLGPATSQMWNNNWQKGKENINKDKREEKNKK